MPELENNKFFEYLQRLNVEEDLRTQIDRLYIYCVWNGQVYQQNTWKGWAVKLLENPSKHYESRNKAFKAFQDAALHFVKVTPDFKEKFPDAKVQIFDQLLKDRLEQAPIRIIEAHPEAERLEVRAKSYAALKEEEEKKAKIAKKREGSLLRLPAEKHIDIRPEALETLFGDQFKANPTAAFDFLEQFLEKHPEYAAPDWKSRLGRLRVAIEQEAGLKQMFSPDGDALSQAERDKQLQALSKQVQQQTLQSGKHAMLLSYGPRELSVDGLALSLRALPKAAYDKLPPFIKEALQDEQPFETKKLVAKILSHIAVDLKNKFGKVDLDPQKLSPVFGNAERQIPAAVAAILPEVIEQTLTEYLQGGILGSISSFFPERMAAPLHWIAMNGQGILEAPTEEALLKELELRIGAVLERQLTQTLKSINGSFTSFEHNVHSVLPAPLLQTLGLDGVFSSGPLWMELEKQANGLFSLNVYAAGMALNLHPMNLAKNSPYAAYRLKDIAPSRLTPEFFHSLLSRHLEPYWNPKAGSRARDIYQGPLQTLGGTVVANSSDEYLGNPSKPATSWQLALNMLLKDSGKKPEFEIRLNALLQLCRPFLKGPEQHLEFKNASEERHVEQAMASLQSETDNLRLDPSMKERLVGVDATFEEIKEALHKAKTVGEPSSAANLKEALFDPETVSKILGKAGITLERLDSWRSTLRWAFGEETGELADFLVDNLRSVVPQTAPPAAIQREENIEAPFGWGFTSYIALYSSFLNMVLQLIFTAIATQYRDLLNAVRGPVLSYLPYILPPALEQWVVETIEVAKLLIAKILFAALWKIALLTPWGKELEKGLTGVKKNIRELKQKLAGESPISVDLEPQFQIPSKPDHRDAVLPVLEHILQPVAQPVSTREMWLPGGVELPAQEFLEIERTPIDKGSALKIFSRINANFTSQLRSENSIHSLILARYIQTWEIPENGKKGMWDEVGHPEECIAELHRIGIKLWDHSSSAFEAGQRSEIVAAIYTVYAIAARLESRCENSFIGRQISLANRNQNLTGKVNAYPLAKWYKAYGTQIPDSKVHERIKLLFATLLPDIDLRAIPDDDELNARARKTLFHYQKGEYSLLEKQRDCTTLEEQYYRDLAGKIHPRDLFEHSYPANLSEGQKIDLLYLEGFQIAPEGTPRYPTFTPAHFIQLRQLSFLCFNATHQNKLTPRDRHTYISLQKQNNFSLKWHSQNCSDKSPPSSCCFCTATYINTVAEFADAQGQETLSGAYLDKNAPYRFFPRLRSEEEIASEPLEKKKEYPWARSDTAYKRQEKETLFAQPEERIAITLSYMLGHLNSLSWFEETKTYLENILFAPGSLEKFLKTRPDGARQLWEFLTVALEWKDGIYFKTWLLYLIIRLKTVSKTFDSPLSPHLPNLKLAIEKIRATSRIPQGANRALLSLLAMDSALDDQDPWQTTRLFCEACAEGPKELMSSTLDFEFRLAFTKRLPLIQFHLSNRDFRNALLNDLIKKRQILVSDQGDWEPTRGFLTFKKGALTYDLCSNRFVDQTQGILSNRLEFVRDLLNPLLDFKAGYFHVEESVGGIFNIHQFISDSELFAKLSRTSDGKYQIELHRTFEGKTYTYLGMKQGISHWRGEDGGMLYYKKWAERLEDPELHQVLPPQKKSQPVPLEGYRKGLEPLARFVPLHQLKVETTEGGATISTIAIDSYKLNFDVADGKAVSREYPGFTIAKVQTDPALKGFTSYLILENGNGERKVLIPYNQWTSSVAWRGFKQLGPIGEYLNRMLNLNSFTPQKLEVGEGVAVYDIQKKGQKVTLASRDPCHVAYLLTLNVLQGNKEAAEKNFQALEWLCNSQQLPREVWNHLLPLAFLQIDIEDIAHLRRRVFAAVAESNQIRGFPENDKPLSPTTEGIILTAILMDLRALQQNPDPRRPVSAKSQYFLFQSVSEKMKGLIAGQLPVGVSTLFNQLGWENIFDEIGLLPDFSNWMRKIRKEAGIPGTWFPKLSQWVLRLWKAPGDLPEFIAGGQYHPILPGAFDQRGGLAQKWLSLLAYGRDTFLFDVAGLHLPGLQKMVRQELNPQPVLDSMSITEEIFKRDFLTYYSIAMGEWPYMGTWNEAILPREKLLQLLHLRKGGWDKQSEVLMKHLEAATAFPQIFHPTKELQKAFSTPEKLEEYFSENNQKAFYSHFFETFLLPVAKNELALDQAGKVVKKVKDRVVGMLPGSDLARFAVNATGQLAQDHAVAALVKQTKPAVLADRPAGTTIFSREGVEQTSLADRGDAPVLAGFAAYGVFAAGWAVQNVVSGAVSYLPSVVQAATTTQGVAAVAALAVGTAAAKVAIAKVFQKPIGPRDILPWWAISGISWLKKGFYAYQSLPADPVIYAKAAAAEVPVDYRELQEAENFFNGVFSTIYNHLFSDMEPGEKIREWAPFAALGMQSPKLKENQESLAAYYKWQEAHPKASIRMNEKGDLWGVALALRSMHKSVAQGLKQEEAALLAVFNREGLKPIDLEFLRMLVEKNTLGKVGTDIGLTDELLPDLALALARIDHKRVRLQQLERVMSTTEEILHFPKEMPPEKQFAAIEKLCLELRNKTPFDFKTTPSRLLRNFLTYQANSGVILWERQVHKIQDAVKEKDESVVTVLPPGMGKTTTINPLLGAILSDGDQIPAFVFPKSLAGDNMPQTHRVLREALGKITYAFSLNRDMALDEQKLEGLLVLFNNALQERNLLQLTKEDALTLRMLLRDWLYAYNHEFYCTITQRQILLLKELNKLVRTKVASIPDEAHETYARRLRFNFPVGKDQAISANRYKMIETTMRVVFNHPILREKIQKNEFVYLNEEDYVRLTKEVFQQLCTGKVLKVKDPRQLKEIEGFFTNQVSEIPRWLKDDQELFEKVSMMKGVMNTLLKTNLKSQANVRFGVSSNPKDGEFIRPSAGNSAVMTNSTVQLPYETLVKTFIYMNNAGLNTEQCLKLVERLRLKAKEEGSKKGCEIERTEIYGAFKGIIPLDCFTQPALLKQNPARLEKIREAMNEPAHRSRFALLYTRFYIWKEIRYWKHSIEGNPQMFSNLFKNELAATGSPYNADTYPMGLNLRSDPAAQGEVLDIIRKKCPSGLVKTLSATAPKEVLSEILKTYFNKGSTFQSLIDGGALLVGMGNEAVATQMLEFCEKNRPEIQAVRFFKPHPVTGQGALHVMKAGTRTAILAEEANLSSAVCVDYNGQVEGFGANNCPAGDSLATVGPHHPLYRLIQEASRNRGLKRDQALKALGEHLIQLEQQHIHFATIQPVKEQIQKLLNLQDHDAELNIEQLYTSAALNEDALSEEDLYGAGREMLQGLLEAFIEDKSFEMGSFFQYNSFIMAFEAQLIKTLEDDPIKLFGHLEGKCAGKKALETLAKRLYKVIGDSHLFTSDEKRIIEAALMAVPNAPRFANMKDVAVSLDRKGGAIQEGADHLVGVEQSMQVSNRQKAQAQNNNQNENEQENQQEVQSDQNNYNEVPFKATRLAKILPWPTIKDPAKTDWLKFSSPHTTLGFRDYLTWKKPKVELEFYQVSELLRQAKHPALREAVGAFDPRLWMSSNFVERKGGRAPTEVGSPEQMKLRQVLVHALEKSDGTLEIKHLGPLMIHETTEWRERLGQVQWKDSPLKTFIWDPMSQTVQGGYPANTDALRKSEDLSLLISQLRFLDGKARYRKNADQVANWLTQNDPEVMERAFRTIHAKRGEKRLAGTHIMELFNRANNVPVEDIIGV